MLKREHLSLCEMKINFLQQFEKYPEFMSTNYRLNDKDGKYLMVSLNAMYIYISTEHAQEYIPMEKIILLMPRLNFLRI